MLLNCPEKDFKSKKKSIHVLKFSVLFLQIWGRCHQSKRKADLSVINHKHNGTSVKVIRNSTNRALKNVKVVTGEPKTKRRECWQSMKIKSKGIRSYSSDPLLGAHSVIHLIYLEADGFILKEGLGHSNFQIGRVVFSYRREREILTSEYYNNYKKEGTQLNGELPPTTYPSHHSLPNTPGSFLQAQVIEVVNT